MNKIITIVVIIALLMLSACSSTTQTNNVQPESIESGRVEVELRLEEDSFEPSTIIVAKGDLVSIQFMDDVKKPYIFALEGYGINERADDNYLEFVAYKEGFFEYSCWDCDSSPIGVLKVI